MKILSLKALNINSLKGTTEIDFEQLTKDNSLFAITGATGSGKSSILDIISCALYGRTSRLKNPNDLMSKHTGEAYCEVEFEVKGKHYRSSWNQKRARKKPDGKFQTPKMEIVDLQEDKIFPIKSKEVPKKVEELSGLDFSRFTQSMLLAQGSFDAFLKADEKERSVLLEKITGTQIYAEISMLVFDKHRELTNKMQTNKEFMDSIVILDKDTLADKQTTLSSYKEQKKQTDLELANIYDDINLLEAYQKIQEDSKSIDKEFKDISQEKDANSHLFEKLQKANKALSIWSKYTTYKEIDKNILFNKDRYKLLEDEIEELQQTLKKQKQEYIKLNDKLSKERAIFEELSKKLKEAFHIQTKEREKQNTLQKSKTVLKQKEDNLKELDSKLLELKKKQDDIKKDLLDKQNLLSLYVDDKNLFQQLERIEQDIKNYKEQKLSLKEYKAKVSNLSQTISIQEQTLKDATEAYSKVVDKYKKEDDKYKALKDSEFFKDGFEEALVLSLEYIKLQDKKDKQEEELLSCSEVVKSLESSYKAISEHIVSIKSYIETLREKKEKEELLKKYEDDRKKLQEGQECFLCGSKEHPFVDKVIESDTDKTDTLIQTQLRELEDKEIELQKLVSKLSAYKTKQDGLKTDIQRDRLQLSTLESTFKDKNLTLLQLQENELLEKQKLLKEYRVEKDKILNTKDALARVLQEDEKRLNDIKLNLQLDSSKKITLNDKIDEVELKLDSLTSMLKSVFTHIDIELDSIDKSFSLLVEKRDNYEVLLKDIKSIESLASEVELELKGDETKLQILTKEIESTLKDIKELDSEILALVASRIAILNVADLDSYEKEIIAKYEDIKQKEQNSKNTFDKLEVQLKEKVTQQQSLKIQIDKDEKKIKTLQDELNQLYKQNSFKDAKELNEAMLSKDEKDALELKCKDIEQRYNKLDTLKTQNDKMMQEYKDKVDGKKDKNELELIKSLLTQKRDELSQSIGSITTELEIDEQNTKKYKDKIALLKQQEEEFKIVVKLNELIGSADGAKFKKFAQGITLDQLISLANQHLKTLSPRYLLSRNKNKLLELEIIDIYQSDAIRPIGTLSGGESFIVSLALALGLSELASKKISIDSLFLDEGFGTLDSQSLEMALDALNLLQNSGKMVGIISHVEALKERIPLQIKVISRGDGVSFVEVEK